MAETDEQTVRTGDESPPILAEESAQAPEPRPKPPAAPPTKGRSGLIAPLLGGVFAAVAGFGLAQFVPDGWPLAQSAAVDQQIAAQAAEIARLEARLAAVETQSAPDFSPVMETLATLNGRVVALENGPAEAAEETAILAEAVTRLQADLAALQATGPIPANVAALTAEAEARLKQAEMQAAAMKAEAEAVAKSVAAQTALLALQEAVERGAPYSAQLAQLGQVAPAALTLHAETGLPSLASLQDSFPPAARAALEAALRADMGDSWTERATSFLLSQTGARSLTPREGSDPDAILSRAEAALGSGDIDLTLSELSGLPGVAQAALKDWRAQAETRQAALRALTDLAGKIGG